MRLTTKGRFAVTAMLDLALRHQRQSISLSYLEQLFAKDGNVTVLMDRRRAPARKAVSLPA